MAKRIWSNDEIKQEVPAETVEKFRGGEWDIDDCPHGHGTNRCVLCATALDMVHEQQGTEPKGWLGRRSR